MTRTTTSKGQKVETFYYRFKGLEYDDGRLSAMPDDNDGAAATGRVAEKEVPIELRLHKEYDLDDSGKNRPPTKLYFSLTCENPKFYLEGADVEALRTAAWEYLDEEFRIQWETYYLVTISSSYGLGSVVFNYEMTYKGTAHDGTLLLKKFEFARHPKIEPWPGKFTDKNGRVIACIPATDANREALIEFGRMINQMRERLKEFFKPETIDETLANLSKIHLLGDMAGK